MDTSDGGRIEVVRQAAQKKLARDWRELPLSESIARGIDAFAEAFTDEEPGRMMRAFLERKR